MKRIDDPTVDLEHHELDAVVLHDCYLDEGYGVVEAANMVIAYRKEHGGPELSTEFIAYLKDEDIDHDDGVHG